MNTTNINYSSLKRSVTMEKSFEVYQFNCNSMAKKVSEIKIYLYTRKPDIVCLCETWLKKNEPKFIGYTSIWQHRVEDKGGLGILVRQDVTFKKKTLDPYRNGNLEFQSIEFSSNTGIINIMNLYNPNKNITVGELEHYIGQLGDKFILLGDFNGHSPLWDQRSRINPTGRSIEVILENRNIGILNSTNTPTYIDHRTGTSSCLDLCLASFSLINMGELHRGNDLGSDHFPIECTFGFHIAKNSMHTNKTWKMKKADWRKFSSLLEQSENTCPKTFLPLDATTYNKHISEKITKVASECIPKTSGIRCCHRSTPWWDSECSRAVTNRRRAKNKLWSHPTPANLTNYKKFQAIAKHTTLKKKRESWAEFTQSMDANTPSGRVWKAIRSINGKQSSRNFPIGAYTATDSEKANLFLDHFTRLNVLTDHSTKEDKIVESNIGTIINVIKLTEYNAIKPHELNNSIKFLKNTTPGEDNIANVFFKKIPSCITNNLLELFNVSFVSGTVPQEWKNGVTCPIPKPGKDPTLVSGYRPITMLSCVGKLMERIIQRRIEYHLETHYVFSSNQAGFRRGRSTMDILATLKHIITQAIDQGKYCLVVYLDLEGAFDCVWHHGLIYKMKQLGFGPDILNWVFDYLTGRTIRVRVGNELSDTRPLNRGLPQGAVLSPTFFNIMLQDIPKSNIIKILSYADDITLSTTASNMNEARVSMQNYLNILTTWLHKWKFMINPNKCSFQILTNKRIIPHTILKISSQLIPRVEKQRVLGIIFDAPKLTLVSHISYIKNECNRRINVLRAISSNNWGASRTLLRRVYISFIRSKMEYGCIIYNEFSMTQMQRLNVIQNTSLRSILGARQTSPIPSLEIEAHISPLEIRFRYLFMKWYTKILYSPENVTTTDIYREIGLEGNNSHFSLKARSLFSVINMSPIKRVPTQHMSPVYPSIDLCDSVCLDDVCEQGGEIPGVMRGSFREYFDSKYPAYVEIYTDGSKYESGSTAAAIYIPLLQVTTTWLLNPRHSVLGSELFAIYKALQLIISDNRLHNRNIVIMSDSMSALYLIRDCNRPSYRSIIFEIQNILIQFSGCVKFQWVRGHSGIVGNTIVDRAANMGHSNTLSVLSTLCIEEVLTTLNEKFFGYWCLNWKNRVTISQKGRFLSDILDIPKFRPWLSHKSRRMECVTARLRIGHVGVGSHMFRFNMKDSNNCGTCNVSDTVTHYLMSCRLYTSIRSDFKRDLQLITVDFTLKNLLGGGPFENTIQKKVLKLLVKYISLTGRVSLL